MRSRVGPAHAEALSRRLEQLRQELDGPAATGPTRSPLTPYDEGWEEHTRIRPTASNPPQGVLAATAEGLTESSGTGEGGSILTEQALGSPSVPRPGKHAARRDRVAPAWFDLSALRGRIDLQPAHVAWAAVVAAVALGITCWWVLADDAGEPLSVQQAPEGLVTPEAVDPAPAAVDQASVSGEVIVDVTGKVRKPGIVVLDTGSRVVDALEAAGGARKGVDLTDLNLARVLVDGEQVVVGLPQPTGPAASAAPSGAPPQSGRLVSLNTAGVAELDELPGVGPVTAQAIIDWRDTNGGFRAVDQLLEVSGIGEKTLAELAPLVTL